MTARRVMQPFYPVGVQRGVPNFCCWDAAMPDGSRFVCRMLKTQFESRLSRLFLGVKQQCDACRVARVEGEVESVFGLHPLHSQRPGRASRHDWYVQGWHFGRFAPFSGPWMVVSHYFTTPRNR
jgi:hypothetical protein